MKLNFLLQYLGLAQGQEKTHVGIKSGAIKSFKRSKILSTLSLESVNESLETGVLQVIGRVGT